MDNFVTPSSLFELVSENVKTIARNGTARNYRKPIYWSLHKNNKNEVETITVFQYGGAFLTLYITKTDSGLRVLNDFTHEDQPQKSFDLLATVIQRKGTYKFMGER